MTEKEPRYDESFMQKILEKVFDEMGAKPTLLAVPVFMRKGDQLELYIVPEQKSETFGSEMYGTEKAARDNLQENQTLYQLNVRRLE